MKSEPKTADDMTVRHQVVRRHVAAAPLGDVIAAAYSEAAAWSTDPLEVSRMASSAVLRIVERSRPRFEIGVALSATSPSGEGTRTRGPNSGGTS